MADKPSRAVVIYGDGHAPLITPSHANLHALASLASCGLLSLRAPPPQENEHDREVRELAQLLDAYESYDALNGELGDVDRNSKFKKGLSVSALSERFMGLRAAIFTSGSNIASFAKNLGYSVFQIDELIDQIDSCDEYSIASELLRLVGLSGGEVSENNEYDLVFLHMRACQELKVLKDKMVLKTGVDLLDRLVGGVMGTAQPGSVISSRLHFSVVLSYELVSENEGHNSSISTSPIETDSDLSLLRPRQSYTMKGGKLLNNIRHHHPVLIAQWQEAVTRRDMTSEFFLQDFQEHGGNLTILADRFLHEVAFKLWKAPKYGA